MKWICAHNSEEILMRTGKSVYDCPVSLHTAIPGEIIFENTVRLSRGDGIKLLVAGNCPRFPTLLEEFPGPAPGTMRNWFVDFVEREDGMTLCVVTLWHEHASARTRTVGMTSGSGCRSHERSGAMHKVGGTRARNERFIKINWRSGRCPL